MLYDVLSEPLPKTKLNLSPRSQISTGGTAPLCPRIRLGDYVELGCGGRASDLPDFDFQTEELEIVSGILVEPVQRRAMFVRELPSNPGDGNGVETGSVGENLSKVGVVGDFKLVLDKDPVIGAFLFANDVGPVRPHPFLLLVEFQLDPQGVAKEVQVIGEPGSEVVGLGFPD